MDLIKSKLLLQPISADPINQLTNQDSKQIHVTGLKRGKTRVSKSRLVWVLLLIGRESGGIFFNQSLRELKQNHNKMQVTFDSQLKTAIRDLDLPQVLVT